MTTLYRLPSFDADLVDIWLHIAEHNPAAADRTVDHVVERCWMLVEHPKAGPARPDIAGDCRHLVTGPVLVLYRAAGDRIELVRALYRGRNITADMFSG